MANFLVNSVPKFIGWFLLTTVCSSVPAWSQTAQIVGGGDAPSGKFPDVVALFSGGSSICSGTLIAPDLVLTAAHCLDYHDIDHVIIGTTDHSTGDGETILVANQVVWNDNWFSGYDIGLLQLSESSNVLPREIALGCALDQLVDGAEATIAGFGSIDSFGSTANTLLKEAETVVVDADCDDPSAGCIAAISPGGELIAGGAGVDACYGDSGGPLYLHTTYGDLLAGVVSRALPDSRNPCGDGGIWVRPDAVIDWIRQYTAHPFTEPRCAGPISIELTVKPESGGPINPNSAGFLPVAIITTADFDATQIDVATIEFGPNNSTASHSNGHLEDIDNDGDVDLVLHFSTIATGIHCGADQVFINGATYAGELISGSDNISTVPCRDESSGGDDGSGGDGLPDLSANIGPNPDCDYYPAPGATRHFIGDLAFQDGNISGVESYHYFGNSTLIEAGGFTQCVATYEITGTYSGDESVIGIDASSSLQTNSCPDGLVPSAYPVSYFGFLNTDGTAALAFELQGEPFAEGLWAEGRVVYANDSCEYF